MKARFTLRMDWETSRSIRAWLAGYGIVFASCNKEATVRLQLHWTASHRST